MRHMQNSNKNVLKKIGIAALAVFAITVAFFAGIFVDAQRGIPSILSDSAVPSSVYNSSNGQPGGVDFSQFWKVWNIVNSEFVPTTKEATTSDTKSEVYGAIQGMVASLGDPYTIFLTPSQNKNLESELSGSLEGVGMEVGVANGTLTVIAPLKDSPAEKAGILAGDTILKIGDQEAANLTVDQAVDLIRGKKGTSVVLTLSRQGKTEPVVVSVMRDTINVPIVETKKLEDSKTFVIKVDSFSDNAPNLFRGALRDFVYSGYDKLVLDLRNDPGGYLEAAVDMASWFLPPGKTIVTEDFGKSKDPQIYRSYGYNIFNDNLKMAILVNGGSASAAEIMAGALSEYGVGTLVGEKTFGKGSVQELIPISNDGAALKVTVARWLTPNGKSISEQGLMPSVLASSTDEDIKAGKDTQLQKAIEVLTNK